MRSLSVAAAAAVGLTLVGPLVRSILRRRGRPAAAGDVAALRWPVRAVAVLLVGRVALSTAAGEGHLAEGLLDAVLVAAGAWVLLRVLWVGEQLLFRRLEIDVADNLRARSRRTQIELLRRVVALVLLVGAALVTLLTLTPLGRIGPSLVAYAGLIGVVLGLALRAPLENLAAGLTIAVTEPVRIDDVVVVEGEWGRIEQIGLVQVVVRLWDDRRLVVPTARFVQEPFENWTRESARVTGVVTMSVDFTTDVEELRREVEHVVDRSKHWDRRDCVVQVTDLGEHAVQVRALVTAATAGDAWDLRCEVREALLPYLVDRARSLPVVRTADPAVVT